MSYLCAHEFAHTHGDGTFFLGRHVMVDHREGERYVEAIRGAREMRERAFREHVSQALREIDWNYTG